MNFNIAIQSQKRNDNNASQAQPENKQSEKVQEQHGGIADIIKNAAHPTLCMVLIGMKISAIVAFLILNWLTRDAIVYLVVILLGSADFWTTKNIAGRILVGLRWWNEVKEDGTEVWIYESKNESKIISLFKKRSMEEIQQFSGILYI